MVSALGQLSLLVVLIDKKSQINSIEVAFCSPHQHLKKFALSEFETHRETLKIVVVKVRLLPRG